MLNQLKNTLNITLSLTLFSLNITKPTIAMNEISIDISSTNISDIFLDIRNKYKINSRGDNLHELDNLIYDVFSRENEEVRDILLNIAKPKNLSLMVSEPDNFSWFVYNLSLRHEHYKEYHQALTELVEPDSLEKFNNIQQYQIVDAFCLYANTNQKGFDSIKNLAEFNILSKFDDSLFNLIIRNIISLDDEKLLTIILDLSKPYNLAKLDEMKSTYIVRMLASLALQKKGYFLEAFLALGVEENFSKLNINLQSVHKELANKMCID